MRDLALALAALALGCGGGESAPITTTLAPTTIVEPPPPVPPPSQLVVHEWGLVDLTLSGLSGDVSSTPACGRPPAPIPVQQQPSYPHPIARPRAPMLYFHLPSGSAPIDVRVNVSLERGSILEHWPLTGEPARSITWSATIRPEHCAGASYPIAGQPPCDHGRCEASELAALETSDASCVRVNGSDAANLFYAGTVPITWTVPITRSDDAVTILNDADEPLPAPVWIVTRSDDRAQTRIGQAIAQPHVPVTLTADHTESDVPVLPTAGLNAARMTSAEIEAFRRAWDCAMFGGDCTNESEPQPTHFVLYWLPRVRIDAMAPLVIEPAPASIERAILVRVDLDH